MPPQKDACQLVVDLQGGRTRTPFVAGCSGCSFTYRGNSWGELGREFGTRVLACKAGEQDPDELMRRAARQS